MAMIPQQNSLLFTACVTVAVLRNETHKKPWNNILKELLETSARVLLKKRYRYSFLTYYFFRDDEKHAPLLFTYLYKVSGNIGRREVK